MTKNHFFTLTLLILGVFLMQNAFSKTIKKEFHRQFKATEGMEINLYHGDGNVRVIPWDKDMVDVKIEYESKVRLPVPGTRFDFTVEFRDEGKELYIIGKETYSGVMKIYSLRRHKYEYTVYAPSNLTLNLEGEDGDVTIENWNGDIRCTIVDGNIELNRIHASKIRLITGDGNIRIRNLEAPLTIQGEDGNVKLSDCQISQGKIHLEDGSIDLRNSYGDYSLRTVDGDIRCLNLHTRHLEVRTSDGSVDLRLARTKDLELGIQTGDGNVHLELPSGTAAKFELQTDDGSINISSLVEEIHHQNRHRVSGQIGNGRGRIRITTSDGNITLRVVD